MEAMPRIVQARKDDRPAKEARISPVEGPPSREQVKQGSLFREIWDLAIVKTGLRHFAIVLVGFALLPL